MDLPTARELELETLLRSRDKQLAGLNNEVTRLRQSLTVQPGPSTSDPVSLPPALLSVLLPHIQAAASSTGTTATSGSNTVTAALAQRARLLQEENDELYHLLKLGETGKLKEEVYGLRKVVDRLQGALRESHQVITSLSTELDKAYENFLNAAHAGNAVGNSKSHSKSPHAPYNPMSLHSADGGTKLPPTGPRAHKRPRLSEPQASPPVRTNMPLPHHKVHSHPRNASRDTREYPPRRLPDARGKSNHVRMELEADPRVRPPSHEQDKEREREKGRHPGVPNRERERDRDGHRTQAHRRNGNFSGGTNRGGPGRRVDRASVSNESLSGDRTLAERMGL